MFCYPTYIHAHRRRMSSCGHRGNSPPPTSGPFSRPRSRSRSPRHTHRTSMGGGAPGASLEGVGGSLGMSRLRKEHSRRSTMGFDQNGAAPFEREQPLLANDLGDSSRSEEVAEWSENEASAEAGVGEEDDKTAGGCLCAWLPASPSVCLLACLPAYLPACQYKNGGKGQSSKWLHRIWVTRTRGGTRRV